MEPSADATGIEIVAAASQRAEIEWIARRIKHLLLQGDDSTGSRPLAAKDIVVAFRTLEPVADLVREVFDEYGVPAAIDWSSPLHRAPVLQSLMGLLRLQAGDWPYRQLLAVLSNSLFKPDWKELRGSDADSGLGQSESFVAVEWAIRQLQFPSGREKLLSALERRAKSDDEIPLDTADGEPPDDADLAKQRQNTARYRTAFSVLNRLAKVLGKLDHTRTIEQWIAAIGELVGEGGLLQAAADESSKEAVERLQSALGAGEQLETAWLSAEPSKPSLADFIIRLQDILSVEELPTDSDDVGRVRVLSAQSLPRLKCLICCWPACRRNRFRCRDATIGFTATWNFGASTRSACDLPISTIELATKCCCFTKR